MSEPLLRVEIDAGYEKQQILYQVHIDIAKGETLGLVGTSGAGKSTLILALMGLLLWRRGWTKGQVLFEGKEILSMQEREKRKIRGKRIALVPQSPLSALNGSLCLHRHFKEAWRAHEPGVDVLPRLRELFASVDLPFDQNFLARKPGQISVGQAQRVVIALAMLHRPALLIADEPTSALDSGNQTNVLKLLRQATRNDETALLYVSHDLLSVLKLCERLAVLHAGTIVETLPIADIERNAQHPVTHEILRSLPVPVDVLQRYQLPTEDVRLIQHEELYRAPSSTNMSDKPSSANGHASATEDWNDGYRLLAPRR